MVTITTNREKIRKRIRQLGYTYGDVAKGAEMSVHTLNRIVTDDDYGVPRPFTRLRLARFLEVSELEIFPVVTATEEAS